MADTPRVVKIHPEPLQRKPSDNQQAQPSAKTEKPILKRKHYFDRGFTKTLLCIAFYLYNLAEPLFVSLITAISVAGYINTGALIIMYIYFGIYVFLATATLVHYLRVNKIPFNYATMSILVESYRSRNICKFTTSGIIFACLIIGIDDWVDCDTSHYTIVDCSELNTSQTFSILLAVCLYGIFKIVFYSGPFSEKERLYHPIYDKVSLPRWGFVPKLWKDTSDILSNLRSMSFIHCLESSLSKEELEKAPQFKDLDWDFVEDLTKQDFVILKEALTGEDYEAKTIEQYLSTQIESLTLKEPGILDHEEMTAVFEDVKKKHIRDQRLQLYLWTDKMRVATFKTYVMEIWSESLIPFVIWGIVIRQTKFWWVREIFYSCCYRKKKKHFNSKLSV